AIRRTILWAERCRTAHTRRDQALFAIVQGGTRLDWRRECAQALVAMDFPGYALGGFSVGESADAMQASLPAVADLLPPDKPRYLMGVGRPETCSPPSPPGSTCSTASCRRGTAATPRRSPLTAPSGCGTPATGEIPPRWSPVALAIRV